MTGPIRVLSIEDDVTIRSSIVAYLEDLDVEVLEAEDGEAGLAVYREQRPDLVLCDLRLPRLDGLEVLQAIAAMDPDVPVVIVSGVGMIADAIQALQRGAWDFITKPIANMEILRVAIERALNKARLLQENRSYQLELERVNRELNAALVQLQADQEAGRALQSRLLPSDAQDLNGFLFRRRLFPAASLSGDFVDYFRISRDLVGFYMADVSGHDTGSAFVTVIVKTLMMKLLRSAETDADQRIAHPAETLTYINEELLCQDLDKYLTMFYGVIDTSSQRCEISNGGQFPYPVLYDGDAARAITARGRPVGLFADVDFPTLEFQLPDVFGLLLMSDGVFELMPDKSNKVQYADLLARIPAMADPFAEIAADVMSMNPGRLADDVTLLAINRSKQDAR